jgi:hypothetical protein
MVLVQIAGCIQVRSASDFIGNLESSSSLSWLALLENYSNPK